MKATLSWQQCLRPAPLPAPPAHAADTTTAPHAHLRWCSASRMPNPREGLSLSRLTERGKPCRCPVLPSTERAALLAGVAGVPGCPSSDVPSSRALCCCWCGKVHCDKCCACSWVPGGAAAARSAGSGMPPRRDGELPSLGGLPAFSSATPPHRWAAATQTEASAGSGTASAGSSPCCCCRVAACCPSCSASAGAWQAPACAAHIAASCAEPRAEIGAPALGVPLFCRKSSESALQGGGAHKVKQRSAERVRKARRQGGSGTARTQVPSVATG